MKHKMKHAGKNKGQLINELTKLRKRISELETLVDAHGGEQWVESELNKGTIVRFIRYPRVF